MAADDRSGMAVALTCKDIAKSVAFYRDQLGFTMKESWPNEDEPMWCNLLLGSQSVMLGQSFDPGAAEKMCAGDAEAAAQFKAQAQAFRDHRAGVGIQTYLMVEDVDAYDARIRSNGVTPLTEPKTQFYGIREIHLEDPDGYRLVVYSPVAMESCQSCGMPLADAKPGQMYCAYCTDERQALRPYDEVFEGIVTRFFMHMQKMERSEAEEAAKEHLGKMPAWAGR